MLKFEIRINIDKIVLKHSLLYDALYLNQSSFKEES